jgi:GNAT superfamily N-acetyltransferase
MTVAILSGVSETNKSMIEIRPVETPEQIGSAQAIFREYEIWLGLDLCFQNFEAELAGLPGRYAPPEGRLYLACSGESVAGCIALRKIGEGICEMKRLYVRDEFRGLRIGLQLIELIISDARHIGYSKMRLDTSRPLMAKAVQIYESHGFREIPPYYDNPHDEVTYMELDL